MRRKLVSSVVLTLALAACQVRPAVTPPGARASALPTSAASARPRVPVPAVQLLAKPSTPSKALSGVVSLDAGYLITNDGGSLITNDGGSLITNDGGSIVAQGGGNIVAQGGGNIVAQGGGNVVAVARGAIVGNDGASLITNDGASVLASGAGNLIVQDAAAVLAGDGSHPRLRLLAAPAAGLAQLPAAGMWLRALSLKDGTALPLGVDPAGKPVYVVATDAKGAFTIYLPQEVAENVRIVASVPHAADARLTYSHVVAPQPATNLALDEGHALVSAFLRRTLEDRVQELLGGGDPVSAAAFEQAAPPDAKAVIKDLRQRAATQGFDKLPQTTRDRVVARIADQILATFGLTGDAQATNAVATGTLETAQAVVDEMATRVAAMSVADREALRSRPWAIVGNRIQQTKGRPAVDFKKVSDVPSLVTQAFFGSVDRGRQHELDAALTDLGLARATVAHLGDTMHGLQVAMAIVIAGLGETVGPSFSASVD
ncbi:MAG: hypothetical protein JWM80_5237, partial [Cyanobacteria bacterium RYN_339]|nr:hypothetical protein [Cyanobacteria bacterium RYN_339]